MQQLYRELQQFLNQPYPECKSVANHFISSVLIGLFIGLFLYIFEPFGISDAGSDKAWFCTMFGMITFGVSLGSDLFMRYGIGLHRDNEEWVFWKWMLSVMMVVVLIAIAHYLLMWQQMDDSLSFEGF